MQIFDFDAPKIFAVEPNVVPIQGGVNVTVRGSNFGSEDNEQVLIFGGTRCESVNFVSSEELTCESSPKIFGVVDVRCV